MSSDEPIFDLLTNFSDSLLINEEEKKNTEENIKLPNYHVLAEKSEKNEKDLPMKKVASIKIKKKDANVEYTILESGLF